ncbi:MAG: transglycosylase SLT domain-containing protein [Paracoccaceae bacterium]
MIVSRLVRPLVLAALLLPSACMNTAESSGALPVMQWDHRPEAAQWTEATLDALKAEGAVLASTIPGDISAYCPSYLKETPDQRRAFWAGLFSAIAKHESTWNPDAKGAGGRYLGLLQISPATAKDVGCDLSQGGLTNGPANLACAVRIAVTRGPEDGEALASIVADWGPMHSAEKRAEVAAFTRGQSYCN